MIEPARPGLFRRIFRFPRTTLPLTAAAASFSLLGGCLIDSHTHRSTSGTYVGRETLSKIEPGSSRKDFVQAALGEPDSKSVLDDGSELWKWCYHQRKSSDGAVFLVLDSSSVKETRTTTYVQFRDEVVVKAWQD